MKFVQPMAPMSQCGTCTASSARWNGVFGELGTILEPGVLEHDREKSGARITVSARDLKTGGGVRGEWEPSTGDRFMAKLSG
jgi:hypothetical protein